VITIFRNSFGANFTANEYELRNGLIFLDEGDPQLFMVYPVGRHMGIRDVKENIMAGQGGGGGSGGGNGGG